MNVIQMKLNDITPYERNPRNNKNAIDYVAKSIKEFGFKQPIVIDRNNVIVCGHTRYEASKKLKLKEVPCVVADDLTDEQIKAYRLADNKVAEFSEWDNDLLTDELLGLDLDMEQFGFELFDEEQIGNYDDFSKGSLREKYICPPFSIIDTLSGEWLERKRKWKEIIHSEDGRDKNVLSEGLVRIGMKSNNAKPETLGVSIFDPVLVETCLAWFCPERGAVIDCFAGGSVRGLVTTYTGRKYTGMDLRKEQIDANFENYEELKNDKNFYGETLEKPNWLCGDSTTIKERVSGKYDFLFTCPPYADLEVYSDDPRDISNMSYEDFISAYKKIIKDTCDLLVDNAYACIVIGEVRGKDGSYYNFVGDTIKAFQEAGLRYYNEIILKTPVGTGAIRANKTFGSTRKVVKMHQNILVFVKGDERQIKLGAYEYEFPEEEDE